MGPQSEEQVSRFPPTLLCLACLALCSSAATAQSITSNPDESRRVVLDYATCVVKRLHDKAAKALLDNADNATIKRDFGRLIDGDCLRFDVDRVKFQADFFRYALADALVRAEFAGGGPADLSDRPPLAHRAAPTPADLAAALAEAKSAKDRDEVQAGFQASQAMAGLSRYGECVVRANPTGARLWILSKPGSTDEAGRIDTLRPSFGACLKDGKVVFSKATLRGTIALNYYRLAHAPVAR
jgi:hypothetical protein